ncbi:MAG: PAS domain-containing protein [Deltaproteobacteria bacterium]
MQRDAVESYSARKETAYRDIRATVGFLLMLTAGGVVATLLTSVTVGRSIIRTENALCERTERYELVAAGAGDAIWDWDVKNHRVCFSPRWSELRGFAPDEVGDREEEWSSGIHPEDVSRVMAAVQAHFEGKTGFFAEEYRVRCKDGSWKWVLDRGIARRDAAGCVDRMAGSESDISQRKDAENALRESERFARSTLDGLSAHIAILDESGTILAVNRPWRAFAAANRPANSRDWGNVEEGANYLSICEKSVGRFSDEGHAAAAGIRAVLTEMLPEFTMEYPCNGPAEERWFLMRVTPFPGDGPRRVVVAHENITKRKVLEREVVEIASLEQRRIGQDLHDSVGQELTALNILAGSLAKNLQTNPSSGPKLVERMVQGLQRSQKELRAVMRGLLPVAVDTEGLMAALSDLAGRIQQEQKATCEFECPEPVSVANNLTATHLYLIAQEAVHNAVKHARPGNIRIMLKANHVLSLSVQDDGIGVPARLTENHGGLGLRIMRNRAAIIGATLTIEPAKPTGTLVTCALDRKNEER